MFTHISEYINRMRPLLQYEDEDPQKEEPEIEDPWQEDEPPSPEEWEQQSLF